jgi:hypothetical protein
MPYSTFTPRKVHARKVPSPYSELVMRGAFVVQLRRAAHDGRLEGLVEEVDTGKQAKFHSEQELIGFLRDSISQSPQNRPAQNEGKEEDGTNEPDTHRP